MSTPSRRFSTSDAVTLSTVGEWLVRQPAILGSFLSEPLPEAPQGTLLVGAGDSYAASSIASSLSSTKCRTPDSYELISDAGVAMNRTTYFVTVSGNTASGVSAARAVREVAKSYPSIDRGEGI